jgi:hypothetical protein
MKRRVLNLVVACTDRKRNTGAPAVRLRDIPPGPNRANAWAKRLRSESSRIAAQDLYIGDHWSIAKDLPAIAAKAGFEAHLWVASAGYGLVESSALLANYSATLAAGHLDSVSPSAADGSALGTWWEALAAQPSTSDTSIRSIAQLVASAPKAALLVVASPAYVRALEDDVAAASTSASDQANILIVTGKPGPRREELRPFWVPSDSGVQTALGGALTSLHARVARFLLERSKEPSQLSAAWAREHLDELRSKSAPALRPERDRSTDDDVRAFINRRIAEGAKASHTGLLREYRASGRACEQSRFRDLFRATTEQ